MKWDPAKIEDEFADFVQQNLTEERWEDPGEYPSAAGGAPLPSHTYHTYEGPEEIKVNVGKDLSVEVLSLLFDPGPIYKSDDGDLSVFGNVRRAEWTEEGIVLTFHVKECDK